MLFFRWKFIVFWRLKRIIALNGTRSLKIDCWELLIIFDTFLKKILILLRPEAPWVANFTQKRLRIAQNTVKDAIFHVKIHCFSKIEAYNGPKWYQGFKNWLLGTFDDFCMFCFSVSNYSQASCKRFMGHKKLYVPRVKRSFGILNA